MDDSKMVKLGGMWKNKMRNGTTYLTGTFGSFARIILIPNTHKTKEGEPDYILYTKSNTSQAPNDTEDIL